MKSAYLPEHICEHLFAALTPENALVLRASLATGLRIGDVLQLTPQQVERGRFTVREQKTGKSRRVYIPVDLRRELLGIAGKYYIFPHRTDPKRHRTRQAVNADLRRAAVAFRVKTNVTPHTMRKLYAVSLYKATGNLAEVQAALNHEYIATTLLYALADELPQQKLTRRRKKKMSHK